MKIMKISCIKHTNVGYLRNVAYILEDNLHLKFQNEALILIYFMKMVILYKTYKCRLSS